MTAPALISRIVCFPPCLFLRVSLIYVVVFTYTPEGGAAAEQAATARLSILHLSLAAFQLVPLLQNKSKAQNNW